jgi:hypothetical protein
MSETYADCRLFGSPIPPEIAVPIRWLPVGAFHHRYQ